MAILGQACEGSVEPALEQLGQRLEPLANGREVPVKQQPALLIERTLAG